MSLTAWLTGVKVTDRELGQGSYVTVLELEYMKCVGKKIHKLLLRLAARCQLRDLLIQRMSST